MHSVRICLLILVFTADNIRISQSAEIVQFTATLFDNTPAISSDSITLMVKLSNCSLSPCLCHIQTNQTGDLISVNFPSNKTQGSVTVKDLQSYTLYSFEINCSEVINRKTYAIRTDVSRPSPPRHIKLTLNARRLQLKWSPPTDPEGPIDEYQVTVNGISMNSSIKNTEFSYQMNEDYVSDRTYRMTVSACNTDTQTRVLCSDPKSAEITYFEKHNNNTTNSNILPTQSSSISRLSFALIVFIPVLIII